MRGIGAILDEGAVGFSQGLGSGCGAALAVALF